MTATPQLIQPQWHRMTAKPDTLGESPFWHPQEGRLYWLDIPGQRLRRMQVGADLSQVNAVEDWPLNEEPGCYAPAAEGGWVMALRSGVYRAQTGGGELTRLDRAA